MTHGSLFSGIGGFDLAAEWMGWENKFHCEWNEFGQKVLHHYWPKAELFTDIKKSNFTKYANRIDILSGGFPCQPYSSAGKRLGKEDDRHLWPEMLRAIREISPRWVVGENVRGLTNWNGGVVFDEVQANLEAEGYEVTPFLLPACAVNAPHRRDRIWFVAHSTRTSERTNELRSLRCKNGEISGEGTQTIYDATRPNGIEGITSNTNSNGLHERNSNNEVNTSQGRFNALSNINEGNGNGYVAHTIGIRRNKNDWRGNGEPNVFDKISETRDVADTESKRQFGLYETWQKNNINGENTKLRGSFTRYNKENNWLHFPTVSPICNGNDGIPDRLDSITFPKWRNESIKAGGNAIVPQVVYQIFKAIQSYESI
jgi:DNA (cytosine-5)-methyltransferase 1